MDCNRGNNAKSHGLGFRLPLLLVAWGGIVAMAAGRGSNAAAMG
jgi:hypothetical protein